MATRSRLGRDPLNGVTQATDKKNVQTTPKSPTTRKKGPAKTPPAKTTTSSVPQAVASSAPQDTIPLPADETARKTTAPEQALPVPEAQSVTLPTTSASEALAADPAEQAVVKQEQAVPINVHDAVPPSRVPGAPALSDSTAPTEETAEVPVHENRGPTSVAPLPHEGPHPVEVFLRGVLEGLTPTGTLRIEVVATPETFGLPVEKLFYFSHAIQLLINPLECPRNAWRRPGDGQGAVASLSARLCETPTGRQSLRIYDNGLFFQHYLSEISLEQEQLRPLLLFILKHNGSILLKQGTCVEFEIIG